MKRWQRYFLTPAAVAILIYPALAQQERTASKQREKPKACVIDIDGTIADETARRAKAEAEAPRETNAKGFYKIYFDSDLMLQDKPVEKAREVLKWVSDQGIDIYYVSSRSQKNIQASLKWLEQNGFPKAKWVYHRKGFKKSADYKTDAIKEIQGKEDVLFGVGDRDTDIEAYHNCGIKAIKVEASSNKDWERVKKEIEKILSEKQ
jgi:predicted secreted acid phosphatase